MAITTTFTPMAAVTVREPNEVELLQKIISLLQGRCAHEYQIKPPFNLIPSKRPEVFIADDHSSRECNGRFQVQCKHCSHEHEASVRGCCPNCLSSRLNTSAPKEKRDVYFPKRDALFVAHLIVARLIMCNSCQFKYVVDEIDQ